MFNRNLYFLVYITLLFATIYGKIMTKDEVLKIKPDDYADKKDGQCPDFSNGDFWYLDRCGFEFYCVDDNNCYSSKYENYTHYVDIADSNGASKKYIADICDPKDKSCELQGECKADSDCLSGKCENKKCVPNDKVKIEKCQDTFYYNFFTFKYKIEMTCGKPEGYTCIIDSGCASDNCSDGYCRFQGRDHNLVGVGSIMLYAGIILVLLVICCIGCICCCCRSRKSRSISNV
ncbi:hypothetical protein LY90DRAFT_677156 [Neocallimastix californiae]|uniref:Uncharacterized protein n=1 Tax=Neocallimastix californiae TaxID=1754190 RepID=A0A1Y2A8T2_9FUNG|nr:hypothetical protein LY90DRAFT_677156 [Neocallimastix californiae]|eukprot:ORY18911.1 hypothetical protein LY90DRAFT_677156 [Neocallimastix californiae]